MDGEICFFGVAHPWLCDVMGHMTTRNYVGMFDDASYHLFAQVGFTRDRIAGGTGMAEMEATYTYLREVRTGTLFEISGRFTALGTKSITAEYEMRDRDTQELLARYRSVIVQFDLEARRAVPVSPDIRAAIEKRIG
jgi:acyl-CoA thioester hydrolase